VTDDLDRAVDDALRLHGREIIGWLCSLFPNEADAYDAFSHFSEQLWRSLKTFDNRCSLRTWCYMLARQSASHVRAQAQRRLEEPLSKMSSIAEALWKSTSNQRERQQQVFDDLRNALDDDDQTLLVLRVDRNLAWRDIAIVMLGEHASEDDIERKAIALRKQFERVKEHLRSLASRAK
jgi:RNA polymerase sigma-70 factor, ECF subfamily